MEKISLNFLNRQIADVQAEIDDCELFGGDTIDLKKQLAALKRQLDTAQRTDPDNDMIVLETGEVIPPAGWGGWGRIHYVKYAMGPRSQGDPWTCTHCQCKIPKGDEHYRRSYYLERCDNRTGHQVRLCLDCVEQHQHDHPVSTTFVTQKAPRRKAA